MGSLNIPAFFSFSALAAFLPANPPIFIYRHLSIPLVDCEPVLLSSSYIYNFQRPVALSSLSKSRSLRSASLQPPPLHTRTPIKHSTMHFTTVSLIPFALIFSLFSTTDALPSRRSVATFEPLFKRAAPQVGPSKAIERLRLRRKAIEYSAERVKTARKARDLVNKRSPAVQPTPATFLAAAPLNPKKAVKAALAKRSIQVAAPTNPKFLAARSLSSDVIINPKNVVLAKRQVVDESEYCDEEPAQAVATRWIPNPKAPTARATSTSIRPTATTSGNATPMSPPAPVETAGRWPSSGGMIASTYYADWEGDMLTPEDLDLSKFDLINFGKLFPFRAIFHSTYDFSPQLSPFRPPISVSRSSNGTRSPSSTDSSLSLVRETSRS